MSTAPNPVEQLKTQEAENTKKVFASPYDLLATIPGAPNKAQIETWKAQTPNGRLRVFTLEAGRRVYIVRALGAMELDKLQTLLPTNLGAGLPAEQAQAKIEKEQTYLVVSKCVLWTNTTANNVLTDTDLRAGSAGLPGTLFSLITWLSDFVDPEAFAILSAEL